MDAEFPQRMVQPGPLTRSSDATSGIMDVPSTHAQTVWSGSTVNPVPPDSSVLHPMPGQPRVVLLKPLVTSPLIEVGAYSYYDDPDEPTAFETRNVLYHYGPEKLIIGKFCALGTGVRFIMNGANHRMDGPSTFPFPIMGGGWAEHFDLITGLPGRGDTVVGNDVWFGHGATVMPGVRIGHGAIIASGAVVVADVPDYGIVGGNPAQLIRTRYSEADVARLLALAWWDWPAEHLTRHVRTVMSGSIDDLEAAAPAAPGACERRPPRGQGLPSGGRCACRPVVTPGPAVACTSRRNHGVRRPGGSPGSSGPVTLPGRCGAGAGRCPGRCTSRAPRRGDAHPAAPRPGRRRAIRPASSPPWRRAPAPRRAAARP